MKTTALALLALTLPGCMSDPAWANATFAGMRAYGHTIGQPTQAPEAAPVGNQCWKARPLCGDASPPRCMCDYAGNCGWMCR